MSLANAADLVQSTSFQYKALGALVYQARQVISGAGGSDQSIPSKVFAAAVLRTPMGFREQATWASVGDPTVNATVTPTDAQILNSIAVAWPYLINLNPVGGMI